jgi:hypothetical protein
MIITDLLGSRVFGPDFLGFVSDVRFYLESETEGQPARLHGILISPTCAFILPWLRTLRCTVTMADRGTGAVAAPRLVSGPMERH